MSKRKNILIGVLTAFMSFGAAIGIAVPLASQHSQSITNTTSDSNNENNFSSEYINLNNGTIESNTLSFKAENGTLQKSETVSLTSTEQTDKISGFITKKLYTVSGQQKDFLISSLYKSERKYMPILEYDDQYVGNNRLPIDVERNVYPGWSNEVVGVTTQEVSKPGFEKSFMKPNEILKKAYSNVTNVVTRLVIDTSMLDSNNEIAKSDVEKAIKQVQPDFLVLHTDQTTFDKLPMNLGSLYSGGKSLKKLQIYGDVTDIKKLQMPSTLQEIEFYAKNLRSIDPLQIPESANLIYDNFISSNFTSADMSGHKNLTTENLQKAINVVYQSRVTDRYFQNHWAGGYIAHWNLRNTGVYSFNGVTIPTLNDGTGRFYIGSVEIETDKGFGPVQNEQIGTGNNPSNDSQIGEWFDWNTTGWSKVTKIVVTGKDGAKVDFDKAIQEVIGFLNKYPNIKEVDLSALTFTDSKKTQDNFVDTLKTKYNPEKIAQIKFVKASKKSK